MGGFSLYLLFQYIKYLTKAVGPHSIHSPFVYELLNTCIKPASKFRIPKIESARKSFLKNHQLIDLINFKDGLSHRKTIRSIAKTSLSFSKFSAFLHLLTTYLDSKVILETGTSLGINSLYLAASPDKKVVTLEGSVILSQIAGRLFEEFQYNNISIETEDINKIFLSALIRHEPDFIFLDADHRGATVVKQVHQIMNGVKQPECIVIHDINWSADMNETWKKFILDDRFNLTIDLFQAGLIFPKKGIEKQHFTLNF